MASITSVISLFILLLATYSYSAPVVHKFEFTTGTTIVEHGSSANMQLVPDDESTVVPNVGIKRSSADSTELKKKREDEPTEKRSLDESTEKRSEDEPTEKRSADESAEKRSEDEPTDKRSTDESAERRSEDEPTDKRSADESAEKRSEDEPTDKRSTDESAEKRSEDELKKKRSEDELKKRSEDEPTEKRSLDGFTRSISETSADFNRRAIGMVEPQEEMETSTFFHSENQMELTTHFEPSSSVDSFAKSTGFLHDGHVLK